jgi:hypothetical protein
LTIQKAIGDDALRQNEYHLLIFKKGIHLENHIFSHDAKKVQAVSNKIFISIDSGGAELELDGTSLFWRIAIAGGSELALDGKPIKLFAKKKNRGNRK